MSRNNVEKQLVQQPGGAQSQWDYKAGGFKAIERKMHNSKSQDKIIDSVFKDLQYKGTLWTFWPPVAQQHGGAMFQFNAI